MFPDKSDEPTRTPTLDERKALLWIRKHQPVGWPQESDPHAPRHSTIIRCLQAGWTCFDPKRRRLDPIAYVLTDAGKRALNP